MEKQNILFQLILESPEIKDIGLANGQLGLSIFFFNLFTRTKNPIYRDIGEQLLEKVLSKLNHNLGYDFDKGYPGILWGINYLAYNNYICIEADTCEEIVKKILSINWSFLAENNYKKEIEGLICCVLSQCLLKNKFSSFALFNQELLDSLVAICLRGSTNNTSLLKGNESSFLNYMETGNINYKFDISDFIVISPTESSENITNIGLFNGLSGYYFMKYIRK